MSIGVFIIKFWEAYFGFTYSSQKHIQNLQTHETITDNQQMVVEIDTLHNMNMSAGIQNKQYQNKSNSSRGIQINIKIVF